MNTLTTVHTILNDHKQPITCLALYKSLLLIGCERDLELWERKEKKCLNTFGGHTETVRCVGIDSDKVISGSDDTTIRIFEKHGASTLTGHTGKVNCLQFDSNKLVTGSSDSTIKIWELSSRKCIRTLQTEAGWVRCLQFSNEHNMLASGHGDNVVRLWSFG